MAKRNTSIRINGRHYDALTGALLSDVTSLPVTAHAKPAKSIDGVVGTTSKPAPTIIKPVQAETKLTTESPVKKPAPVKVHVAGAHAKAHTVKPSATLMRHAVNKPQAASLKRHAKVQGSTLATAKRMYPVKLTPKASVYRINADRLARATQVNLSPKISRFAQEMAAATPVAAQEALVAINKAIVIPQIAAPQRVVYRPDVMPVRHNSSSADIFERALQRATSHEQPAPVISTSKRTRVTKSLRRRMVSYSAGAVAVLAIAGFFGVQNLDTIQFRVASSQAGFAATMPSYKPAGFAVDSVRSYNGYVGLKYVADSINGPSSFAITEKPSNWNSATLLNNIQANSNTASYRVVEKAGRTVYLYGNNQAAWVNNGILYQLVSTSELGNHEIGQIAASM